MSLPTRRSRSLSGTDEARVAALMRSGAPISARALSRAEYAAYLRLSGVTPAASYAARGTSEVT